MQKPLTGEDWEKQLQEKGTKVLQIADKDCVALEVKYHRQCYQRYTEFVRRTDVTEDDEVRAKFKYEESFNFFVNDLWKKN